MDVQESTGIFKTYITKIEPFREKLRYHHMVNQKSCQTETFKTHRCVPIILTICYFITWINELKYINMLCIHLYKLTLNWNEYWQAEIWQKSISNYLESWIKCNLKRNKILIYLMLFCTLTDIIPYICKKKNNPINTCVCMHVNLVKNQTANIDLQ